MKYLLPILFISCTPEATPEELAPKETILYMRCRLDQSDCLDKLHEHCANAIQVSKEVDGKNIYRTYHCGVVK